MVMRVPPGVQQFEGKLFKVTTDRTTSPTDFARFKYDRRRQNLEEVTGMSRSEMPKHSMWIYTNTHHKFGPGDKCELQHMNQQLKVKMETPDVSANNSFAQASVTNESGFVGKIIFFE